MVCSINYQIFYDYILNLLIDFLALGANIYFANIGNNNKIIANVRTNSFIFM